MNLAYREIRHNLGRFLLTCLGLSLLLGVVLSMIGIYRGIVVEALTTVWAPKGNLWVVQFGTQGPFAKASRIPGDTREAIARLSGVTEAGAVTYQSVETFYVGAKLRIYAIGYEPARPGGPDDIVAGRPIGRSHYEIVADTRTGLSLGDRLQLGRRMFTVVGLTQNQVASSGDPVVYLSLIDSQVLQFELAPPAARRELARGTAPGTTDTVNAVVARLSPNVAADDVAAAVRRWKHLTVITQAEQETILTTSVVDRFRKQIGLFTSILLTVSAVIIALIIYTMTMDKLREIATLKLVGAPDRVIVGSICNRPSPWSLSASASAPSSSLR
jgi:putative ABC transport system permease protein